jgi:hypothetical protein
MKKDEIKMTTENKNEIAEVTEQTHTSVVVRENDDYVVLKEDGKYIRKAKFAEYSSIHPETKEEKIWMLNLLEGDEETGNGLKSHAGKIIEVANVITRKYDRINEESGQQEFGVLTYLITPDKIAYVTSSKTVYFSIMRIMDLFGKPDSGEWENIKVKVGKEKGQNGDMIKIKMIG